jgi:uncharacterized membrane protein (UPF0127 family)
LQPAACALLAVVSLLAACRDRRPEVVIHTANGNVTSVAVEVADTPDTQTRGLMYRQKLEPDHGMIFLFEDERPHSFWMKNTQIPLDMIFISRSGVIVGIHPNAEPLALVPIDVGKPSRAVLEVAGGWAAAHGIAAGDHVTYRNIASTKLP